MPTDNVKIEGTNDVMALRPSCLIAADRPGERPGVGGSGWPGMGGGGGMPGMGGMPGGMGGMPGGMGGLAAMLSQMLGAGGMPRSLPGGLKPQHLGVAALAVLYVLPKLGFGMWQLLLLGGAGVFVHRNASGGRGVAGVLTAGREALGKVSASLSRATGGRAFSLPQTAMLLAAACYLVYKYYLAGGGDSGSGGGGGARGYAAYSKGYADGKADKPYDPIADEIATSSSSTGGGWGVGKLFNLAIAGSMVYQMGGQPWSVDNLVASARTMSPINMIMLFNIVSGLFS